MTKQEFRRLRAMLARLTATQRVELLHELQSAMSQDASTAIIESRLAQARSCPRCDGEWVVKNGHADGLQRYKCRSCGSTFNALTNTPLARLRHRDRWLGQAEAMSAGLSVRKTAVRLKVHRTTEFRWRHRWLERARTVKAAAMVGVVEADETYELRSYKGQKARLLLEASRAPRRRGGRAAKRGLSREQVPILVLRNRSGDTSDFVLPNTGKATLKTVLPVALADDAVLCTDGSNHLSTAARELAIEHQAVVTSAGERVRGPWHIQNVNAYHSRWKGWLRRFHGIATSYLPNYLGWFRALDRNARSRAEPSRLLALAIGI